MKETPGLYALPFQQQEDDTGWHGILQKPDSDRISDNTGTLFERKLM